VVIFMLHSTVCNNPLCLCVGRPREATWLPHAAILFATTTDYSSSVTGRFKITHLGSNQNHPPWWAVM
jgi:hypothetical protein